MQLCLMLAIKFVCLLTNQRFCVKERFNVCTILTNINLINVESFVKFLNIKQL